MNMINTTFDLSTHIAARETNLPANDNPSLWMQMICPRPHGGNDATTN